MAAAADPGSVRDDRVLPVTRWLSVAIIPFLVVAFAVLYLFPHDTGRLFAWPVKPTLTSMIPAQDRVLVPKHHELSVLGRLMARQHRQAAEQAANEQVDSRNDHPSDDPSREVRPGQIQ
jgi:hypothetical protein